MPLIATKILDPHLRRPTAVRGQGRGRDPAVTNRDLRRRWKTLAGQAGASKEIPDRIQNHALQDMSSKSYDRWNYMPEKRAGIAKWDKFVRAMLAKKRMKVAALTRRNRNPVRVEVLHY
jgi:hypothetical protein